VSVVSLLAVREEYEEQKDEIWVRYEDEWVSELRRIAIETSAFKMAYQRIVATNAAIIALAEDSGAVNALRSAIYSRLRLPRQSVTRADITHTTLFRYGQSPRDPQALLNAVSGFSLNTVTEISDIVISKELVYPSLAVEDLHTLPLGPGSIERGDKPE
jgi:hypothetical protein